MIRPSGCSSYHSIAFVGVSSQFEVRLAWVVARHSELSHISSGANHMFRAFRSIWNPSPA